MNTINKQEEYMAPLTEIIGVSELTVLCTSQSFSVEILTEDEEFVW